LKTLRSTSLRAIVALRKAFSDAEVRALFADIRAHADETLLEGPIAPKKAPDPAVAAVTALLAPFPANSAQKAAMLRAHLEKLVGRPLPVKARGLPDAVRALKAHLSEDDIRDGAFSLRVTLQAAPASSDQTKKDPR
jgi:hypothetical protein